MVTGFRVKRGWVLHLLSAGEPEFSLVSAETAAPSLAEMFVASPAFSRRLKKVLVSSESSHPSGLQLKLFVVFIRESVAASADVG